MCFPELLLGQVYKIGDIYTAADGSKGVVYYIYPDGSGGWAVALNDDTASCTWGIDVDVPGLINQDPHSGYHSLLNDTSGYSNTLTLRLSQNANGCYAAGVVDFDNGWVLPSPRQLRLLYGQLPMVSSSIISAGGTDLSYDRYWCSAEKNQSEAWALDFGTTSYSGFFIPVSKSLNCHVRAVRSFSNTSIIYDTTLSYLWNTGSTQPHISVQPIQTSTYSVTATTDFGCNNTAEQIIIVGDGSTQTIYDTICRGVIYDENGFLLSSGETDTIGTRSYTRTLSTSGCASDLTLELTIKPTDTTFVTHSACNRYIWNGVTYYESGTYTQYFNNRVSCDSVVILSLTINFPTDSVVDVTVLENDLPYILNGEQYSISGTYYQYLDNAVGCDSVLTINLSINHNMFYSIDSTVCASDLPIVWNGVTCSASGIFSSHQTSMSGADSTIFLNLTVNPTFDTVMHESVCQGESYDFYGQPILTAGEYTHMMESVDGCDSSITLILTVNTPTDSVFNVSVLENDLPYIINDEQYTIPGTYYQHFINEYGCDSTLVVNFTVVYNSALTLDTTVCAADLPYTWHGHTFVASGSRKDTLTSYLGSDSVVTYLLLVDELSASIGSVTHINCFGTAAGSATAMVSGGSSPIYYQWIDATGNIVANTTNLNNSPAGHYIFMVTDNLGCTSSDTVTIHSLNGELVPGEILADQTICDNEELDEFVGTPASGGDNGVYQWQISFNGTDWVNAPGVANTQNYTYADSAMSDFMLRRAWVSQSCGIVYSNSVLVSVFYSSFDTVFANVCQGESYQENGFDVSSEHTSLTGEYAYEKHFATDHCDSVIVLMLMVYPRYEVVLEDMVCEGNEYNEYGFEISSIETIDENEIIRTRILQSEYGCDSIVSLHLMVIDTSLMILSLTDDFCENQSAELMAMTGMPDYVWSTGETTPVITVDLPGYYYVTASEDGCSNTSQYFLDECLYELYLPNAITPSRSDGLNDYFCIPELNQRFMTAFEISIYNRWGEMVYYSTDKSFKWDGEYHGKIQAQTVYNYVIKYTDKTGRPVIVTGSVTVL